MPRIRTIKPEFFRHGELQDLECNHPGAYTMLVFVGLFGHADINGVFPWDPRQLKLDILPFLSFEIAATLEILRTAGFIEKYEVDGKTYGRIPTFRIHQRISGKEASSGGRYPLPDQGSNGEATGKQPGSNGEFPESQELGTRNLEQGTSNWEQQVDVSGVMMTMEQAELFDEFWQAYPKERRTGKGVAVKAWMKIGVDALLSVKMVQALEKLKLTDQWNRDSGQFIPMPTTWLNQRRWEDDIPDEPPGARKKYSNPALEGAI